MPSSAISPCQARQRPRLGRQVRGWYGGYAAKSERRQLRLDFGHQYSLAILRGDTFHQPPTANPSQLPHTGPILQRVFDNLREKFGTVLGAGGLPAPLRPPPLAVERDADCKVAYLPGLLRIRRVGVALRNAGRRELVAVICREVRDADRGHPPSGRQDVGQGAEGGVTRQAHREFHRQAPWPVPPTPRPRASLGRPVQVRSGRVAGIAPGL